MLFSSKSVEKKRNQWEAFAPLIRFNVVVKSWLSSDRSVESIMVVTARDDVDTGISG